MVMFGSFRDCAGKRHSINMHQSPLNALIGRLLEKRLKLQMWLSLFHRDINNFYSSVLKEYRFIRRVYLYVVYACKYLIGVVSIEH